MRFLSAIVLSCLLSVSTQAETSIDYSDRIELARKTGHWIVVTNNHLFQLGDLFFPDRPVARVKFIQDLVKLNSGYFINGELRSLVPGLALRLPGYVMLATDTVPAQIVTANPEPSYEAPNFDMSAGTMSSSETSITSPLESTPDRPTAAETAPVIAPTEKTALIQEPARYTDQYMETSELEALDEVLRKQPKGRRSLDAEYYYHNSNGTSYNSIEQGLNLDYRIETLQSGNLFLNSSFQQFNTEIQNNLTDGDDWMLKLGHTDMPVGNTWIMDNTFGQQRTLADAFLLGGYRYRLPGSQLAGLTGRLRSEDTQFKWYAGNTGAYKGISSRRFENDGGETAGLFMQHELTPTLSIGGALSALNNHSQVEDHTSLLGAFSFHLPNVSHDLHILINDDGNLAVWNDNSHNNIAQWRIRYGIFHAQPDLKWNNSIIASDQQGLYAQATTRRQKLELSLGYDFQEFGLESSSPGSTRSHSVFANSLYNVNRTVNTGITTSIFNRSFDILGGGNLQQNSFNLSQFLRIRSVTGITSIDLFYSQTNSSDNNNNSQNMGLSIRKNWRLPLHQDLELEVRAEQTNYELQSDTNRVQTSISYTNDWQDNLSWSIDLTAFQNQNTSILDSKGVHAGLSALWQITPRWHGRLNIDTGNSSDSDPYTSGERKTKTISFTLGYSQRTGRPFQYYGQRSSSNATGKIKGIIFFDENRDGIKQHNEKFARGVRILLDGKYETLTDQKGEYEYTPVYTGAHTIELIIEDLPLPWTLEDESKLSIRIDSRQTTRIDFSLIKI